MTTDLRDQLQRTLGTAYTIERELGGGGMSRVFLARDESLGREVVIKVLSPELAATLSAERFTREIKLAAALQEPHIVPLLSAGVTSEGLPYYTMPFVRGDSLRARMSAGRVPVAESTAILRNVAQALSYAHRQGLVHRDIKPENVLFSSGTAVVTDFGIAKALAVSKTEAPGGTLTEAGTSLGTPAYMAPEQAAGDDVDARADLYAWGVMAWELLAGRHPFSHKTTQQQLIAAHLGERPTNVIDQLPEQERGQPQNRRLAALVMRCLEKHPPDRPANGGDILSALDAVPASAATEPTIARRMPARAIAAGALLVLAVAAALVFARTRGAALSALEPKRVVVATFENKSGDHSLDPLGAMAADWIARGLANTGLVDVGGTSADLAARGATSAASGGGSALLALARDAKAGLVISGAYYRQGDSVLFQADFTDADAGKLVQSVGPVAAAARSPLDGIERLRQRVIGGLAPIVDSALAGLAGVTSRPPNIEAYREFLAGEDLFYKSESAAIPRYFNAAALDSTYLYPLVKAAALYNLMHDGRGMDSVRRVLDRHRAQLTPFEQAYLDFNVARQEGEVAVGMAAARAMAAAAPKSGFAVYLLAIAYDYSGDARTADSIFSVLDPESGALRGRVYFYERHTSALHSLGKHARELEVARRFRARYPTRLYPYTAELRALAALGREDEITARVTDLLALPDDLRQTPSMVVASTIYELRFHGHTAFAESLGRRLLEWRDGRASAAASNFATRRDRAEVLMVMHRWDELQALADTMAAERAGDLPALRARGVALAMRGKRAEAEQVVAQVSAGDGRLDGAEMKRTMLFIAAALGDHPRAMALLPALQLFDNRAEFTLVGELLKNSPPFQMQLRGGR